MPFIGLQPIIDKIQLPSALRSPLALQEQNAIKPMPCYIVSSRIAREYTIPQEPVDSQQMVSDTIIHKPVTVSLTLFVYESSAKEFFEALHRIQNGNKGFIFTDRKGETYADLYMTSYSLSESSSQIGSFDIQLELQQVIRVQAIASQVVKLPTPASDPQSKGTNNSVEVPKEQATPPDSGDTPLKKRILKLTRKK